MPQLSLETIRNRRRRLRIVLASVVTAGLVTSMAACSSSESAPSAGSTTLTIVAAKPPTTLNPLLADINPETNYISNLSYATLIHADNKSQLVPDLAESWKFTDSQSEAFELTLRKDLKFADGSPLTADDVVSSLEYARKNNAHASWLAPVTSITAPDKVHVDISLSQPYSILPYILSSRALLGSVVSTAALNNPDSLKSETFGAGPYVLDAKSTIADDTYVYLPNKNYWNQSNIHWKKVIVKVSGSYDASLQAVQTGEAQIMWGDSTTATAAKQAGLGVETAALGWIGIIFADQEGVLTPALASPKVRQALNYAIDRKAISNAVFGADYATPGASLLEGPGAVGYTKAVDDAYPYNVDKAKKLLADAGYADGFEVSVLTTTAASTWVQAVIENWKAIGVTVKLDTVADSAQFTASALAKKDSVLATSTGGAGGMGLQAQNYFTGGATFQNPFGISDPTVTDLVQKASIATTDAQKQTLYNDMLKRVVETDAWTAIISHPLYPTIYDPKAVEGVTVSQIVGTADIAWAVRPK